MKLENKVCIITGAGSGIGKGMALRFAAEGARLVIADIDAERVEKVLGAVRQAGAEATGLVADVSRDADIGRIFDAAQAFGRVDVLCNNAGVMDQFIPVAEVTDEHWNRILGINLNGAFYACRRAIPLMLEQGGGAIVNTASVAGMSGGRGGGAYTASKHALVGLTRSIAWYYGPKGIRCNALCPGSVSTAIGMGGDPNPGGFERMTPYFPTIPRPGKSAEIASAALFLASSDSSYVNGTTLLVDGGWSVY